MKLFEQSDENIKKKLNIIINCYKVSASIINWQEFELYFGQVHQSFYKNLNQKYPSLTPNEQKICAFLKLNMSNKEISAITFKTENSIKKARLRLRKKIGIAPKTNIVNFIQQF
ncbi:MAG: hypothetical protein HY738_05735 [Bacteroidia bacterium]|nr:hypothetical protein [Bacteroidia bacterium]